MKRNEQISEAASIYAPFDVSSVNSVARAFYDGARWADANPLWHDADVEFPEWNEDVILACKRTRTSEVEYCIGYHNRGWHLEDEDLDATGRILAWMRFGKYEPKTTKE